MIRFLHRLLTAQWFQKVINKNNISRVFGKIADSHSVPKFILKFIIRKYIRTFRIETSDFDFNIGEVKTFNEFFTRAFLPGKRVFNKGIASPAEGYVAAYGNIESGQLYQVKGKSYRFSDLIKEKNQFLETGSYLTIFISPGNYHRFHAPFDMEIKKLRYIPGTLHSMNTRTLVTKQNLYCENERFVISGNCDFGVFYYVAIGAIIIGSIKLSFSEVESNRKNRSVDEICIDLSLFLEKGREVGRFEMGSTIILSMEKDCLSKLNRKLNSPVLLGETLWAEENSTNIFSCTQEYPPSEFPG